MAPLKADKQFKRPELRAQWTFRLEKSDASELVYLLKLFPLVAGIALRLLEQTLQFLPESTSLKSR